MKRLLTLGLLFVGVQGWAADLGVQEPLRVIPKIPVEQGIQEDTEKYKKFLTDIEHDSQAILQATVLALEEMRPRTLVKIGVGGGVGLGDQAKYSTAMMCKLSVERRDFGAEFGGHFNHVYEPQIRTYYDPTVGLTKPLSLPEIGERYNVYFAGVYWKGALRWGGPVPFVKIGPSWTLIRGLDRDVSTLGSYCGVGVEGMSDKNGAFWELEVGRRDAFVTRGEEYAYIELMLNLGRKF